MDPLSFTASVLAVISAAQMGVQGLRKLSSYRHAPQELDDLISELEGVQKTLRDIETFLTQHPQRIYSNGMSDCLWRTAVKIADIDTIINSKNLGKILGLSDHNQARLVWIRYKHRLVSLREDLHVCQGDMAIQIGLATA
jgi:hypothetical protein